MDTLIVNDLAVRTYVVYLLLSISITIWVARTLSKSGDIFLVDVFAGNKELAKSVNHLLVVGFYLVNLGFVSLFLKIAGYVPSVRQSVEVLSEKIGIVLLVLGVMHFTNMIIFKVIRSGHCADNGLPPVMPDGFTTMGGSN